MAKIFPEVFPGAIDQGNPEFVVYQALRSLPDDYDRTHLFEPPRELVWALI
jgi:hypothetical protein